MARTAAFSALAVGGAGAAVAGLTYAGTATAAAFLPVVAASLIPAAAVAYYLSRDVDAPWLPGAATGGFLVLAAYFLTVAATGSGSELTGVEVVFAATAEEAVKLAAAGAFVYVAGRMEPVEAAAVGASFGLGFSGVENLVHVSNSMEPGLMALERAAIAPLHVLTTASAAAALVALPRSRLNRSIFPSITGRRSAAALSVFTAAGVAALLHSVYNLGVLGFVHPEFGDGVGYVGFAMALYVAAFATVEVLRQMGASDSLSPEDAVGTEPEDSDSISVDTGFQSES